MHISVILPVVLALSAVTSAAPLGDTEGRDLSASSNYALKWETLPLEGRRFKSPEKSKTTPAEPATTPVKPTSKAPPEKPTIPPKPTSIPPKPTSKAPPKPTSIPPKLTSKAPTKPTSTPPKPTSAPVKPLTSKGPVKPSSGEGKPTSSPLKPTSVPPKHASTIEPASHITEHSSKVSTLPGHSSLPAHESAATHEPTSSGHEKLTSTKAIESEPTAEPTEHSGHGHEVLEQVVTLINGVLMTTEMEVWEPTPTDTTEDPTDTSVSDPDVTDTSDPEATDTGMEPSGTADSGEPESSVTDLV